MIVLRLVGIRHSIGDAPWQADDAEGTLAQNAHDAVLRQLLVGSEEA